MGKLEVIETTESVKDYHDGKEHIRPVYSLKDEELGIVIKPDCRICNIQILDDDNVFVWFDEGREFLRHMNMYHFQRGNNRFLKKYTYLAPHSDQPLPDIERINDDNVVIAKVVGNSSIYSLLMGKEITVDLKAISEFTGEEGEKTAIVEIAVPLDITEKNKINFLFGKIDEYGNYVSNFFDINGTMYDIASKEYQVGGIFSARRLVELIEKRYKTRDLEEQRLHSLYFSSPKK